MSVAPLVWINALPGTGKLTVAKEIKRLDGSVIIIDNHSLIDPVASRLGPDSRSHPQYQVERQIERARVFEQIVCCRALKTRAIIFTDCQTDNELGRKVAQEYSMAAQVAGRPFIPIYLYCDPRVNFERAMSQERVSGTTTKLTDLDRLKQIIGKCTLFKFEDHPGLSIDTTCLLPVQVAQEILAHCYKVIRLGEMQRLVD